MRAVTKGGTKIYSNGRLEDIIEEDQMMNLEHNSSLLDGYNDSYLANSGKRHGQNHMLMPDEEMHIIGESETRTKRLIEDD